MAWFDIIERDDGFLEAVIAFNSGGGPVASISAPSSFGTYS